MLDTVPAAGVVEEALDDPDGGLVLRAEIEERLARSLAHVDAVGATASHTEVAERLRSSR